jgi:hypothetical protein
MLKHCNSCRKEKPEEDGQSLVARSSGRNTKVWRCNSCIKFRESIKNKTSSNSSPLK